MKGLRALEGLTRAQKRAVLLVADVALAPVALGLTFVLLYNSPLPIALSGLNWWFYLVIGVISGVTSAAMGINRIKLNAYESRAILRTSLFALVVTSGVAILSWVLNYNVPVAAFVLFWLMFFLISVGTRYLMLHTLLWFLRQGHPICRVLIYGAGTTGMQLAAALKAHDSIIPVAFLDDNRSLQALTVAGLPVYSPENIQDIAQSRSVNRVLLAMPSASVPIQMQIARRLEQLGLEVMALPSFAQLIGEETLVDKLTKVQPGQFLGRERLDAELPAGCESYSGRSILVSGAGGSIGSELCRQLLSCNPARLVLFEVSEAALYIIDKELRGLNEGTGIEIIPVLGSVTDARMAKAVMKEFAVEIVLHAAAYKHVPLVEANPLAGLVNNVMGTRTLADAANESGVKSFILISTDKAVRPTNIMGASKRLAEIVVQDMSKRSNGTIFSMVRFGNVLGSSGSVIPLFKEQIARGGPVTLTHDDVTRYFMTIAEASRLVLLAGSFARGGDHRGGDVFVLDMGKPIRIRELARQMIEAAGYTVRDDENPAGDIEIVTTGLRPGEKLHEELLIGEGFLTTPHPKILRVQEAGLSEIEVATVLRAVRMAATTGSAEAARDVARRWVEGYETAERLRQLNE